MATTTRPGGWTRRLLGLAALLCLVVGLTRVVPPPALGWGAYGLFLTIQLLIALVPFALAAVSLTAAGYTLRWLAHRSGRAGPSVRWRWWAPEAAIAAGALTGAWLAWHPQDTYLNPEGSERLAFRQPSLLEGPLGLHACSDVFVPVTVTYTDAAGRPLDQRACEAKESTAAMRVMNRVIQWSANAPGRVVVILPATGMHLFFPEPLPAEALPTQPAIDAYLNGEPVAAVHRLCGMRAWPANSAPGGTPDATSRLNPP
ncbi:MAG: hypothetical protein FJ387_28290 [Verrucomicrobia bacterium]|nr:hypothetical protein [Verrucomicrobiota bacterium]